MDLRQLRNFTKIIELGSISRAADAVFVAQSALSQQVAALEAALGCKLLLRNARGVSPTLAGETLHRHALSVLKSVENLQTAVGIAGSEPSGRVTLGLPVSISRMLTVPLLHAAAERLPNVVLAINESPSNFLPELLLTGRLDLALIYSEDVVRNVQASYLLEEDLFLIENAATASTRDARADHVPLSVLQGLPVALTAESNSIRKLVDAACRKADISYRLVAEVSSPTTLIEIARSRLAATIMSWSALGPAYNDPALSVKRLDPPNLTRTILLAENSDMPGNEASMAIKSIIGEVLDRRLAEQRWHGARKVPINAPADPDVA